jgi:hypothetical protein
VELAWILIEVARPSIEQFFGTRRVIGLSRWSHHRYAIFVSLNKWHILSCISHKMLFALRISHILERDFLRLLMLLPLLLSEVHTVMVLIYKWFFEMAISILCPDFKTYLIVIKIRGALILLLLFESQWIPTFHLLRISESYVRFRAKFIWRNALCTINTFMVRCRGSFQEIIHIFLAHKDTVWIQLKFLRGPSFDSLR